jgi:ABC-type transport system substrate-binding protein
MPLAAAAATTSGPLFSMVLIAPTSNPTRRQWAAIITQSLDALNIGASLVYINFDQLSNDLLNCPAGCPPPTYANGGFDAGFIGWGGGTPLPDFGTGNVVNYLNNGPSSVPPLGYNYMFFDNATYNSLANQYDQTFSQAARIPILQQMVSIVAQQRPAMVLFYPVNVYVWASDLQSWGSSNAIDAGSATGDYSHWAISGGGTTLNIGETGDIFAVNSIPTAAQASTYNSYLGGGAGADGSQIQACGQCIDPRTTTYYNNTVTSITSSSDHLSWTVTERPHVFSDGVAVTANDYIYGAMVGEISSVGYVGEGSFQTLMGLNTQYTFSNGTTDYVANGTYYHNAAPPGFTHDSTFQAFNNMTWKFTMPKPYVFADPVITSQSAVPMHVYDNYAFNTWATGPLAGFTGSSGGLSTSPFTYHYSTAVYGGNGTGESWGPVGDGPYVYHGYDPVAQVGTLVRNNLYWNASALQAVGWDKVQTVHVVYINSKDAAIAALSSGQVNFLDTNYQFDAADVTSLQAGGFTVVKVNDPSNGWQEMGLNMNNPYFGTGAQTPLGQLNPSEAAFAARMVREAISYAIPRQYIVDELLGGLGVPGITQITSAFAYAYPAGITVDPYDQTMAKSFLAAAGYQTGVPPPSIGTGGATVTIGSVPVPGFLLGNSFTLTGNFKVDPVLGAQSGGFAVTLQQSSDGGTTWTPVALGSTNAGGYFTMDYQPAASGNFEYRVFFTGLPETTVQTTGLASASSVESLVPPLATLKPLNVTDIQYSVPVSYNIGSLSDLMSAMTSAVNTGLSKLSNSTASSLNGVTTQMGTLNTNVNGLTSQINTLNSNLSTTTDIAYVAIAVAIILGIAAITISRRKPA